MIYLEHRRFLPPSDPLRRDFVSFPHKRVCNELSPQLKTQEYVDKQNQEYMRLETSRARSTYAQGTGCTGASTLRTVPFHDRHLNTPVEPMHLIKNIGEHTVNLICGKEDSHKVRAEEKARMRFPDSWVSQGEHDSTLKVNLPPAPFRLSKDDIKLANKRVLNVCTPYGMDWKKQEIFGTKCRLKSAEWKHLMTCGILKYCLRGMLGTFQRKTLMELCDVLSDLVAEELETAQLEKLEYRTHRVLALIERDFPTSINVVVFHLLHHLPMFLRRFGPVHTFWMFPHERFNSWIGRRVHNKRFPEATVLETYRIFELSSFLSMAELIPANSVTDMDAAIETFTPNELPRNSQKSTSGPDASLNKDLFIRLKRLYMDQNGPDNVVTVDNVIIKQKLLTRFDNHGRCIHYSSNIRSSMHSSCIVWKQCSNTRQVMFGEIIEMFQHTYSGQKNSLVSVKWFEEHQRDESSNLLFVDTLHTRKHIEINFLETISRPLVHAYEEEKLWVLSRTSHF